MRFRTTRPRTTAASPSGSRDDPRNWADDEAAEDEEPFWRAAPGPPGPCTAASRSTRPAAPSRAPGGRPGSSRCWRPPGSVVASPAAAPTPVAGRRCPCRSTRVRPPHGWRAARRGPTGSGSACRRSTRRSGPPCSTRWPPTPRCTAAMLAGELPREVEDVGRRAGRRPVPERRPATSPWTAPARTRRSRVSTSPRCSTCSPSGTTPTRSPCSRCGGRDRETVLDELRARRTRGARGPGRCRRIRCAFYGGGSPELPAGPSTPPDTLLDRVPALPLAVRGRDVVELLRPLYRALDDG